MSTIQLPTKKVKAESLSPDPLLIFGPPKVGKTSMLAKLPNCLIIDLEKGTRKLDALKVSANSLAELMSVGRAIKESEHKYDYIALDPIDKIADWIEAKVAAEKGVAHIGEIEYGAGYGIVRTQVMQVVDLFKTLGSRVIIVGHLKKTVLGSDSVEFSESSLDLTGKLKNIVMADMDAIGFVHRSEEDKLMVSFNSQGGVECGSRSAHLAGKVIPFDWKKIYID